MEVSGLRSQKDFAQPKPLGVLGCETTGFCSGGLGCTRGFLLFLENYIGCDLTISMRFIGSSSTSEVAAFFGPPFYLFFFFLCFFLLSCSVYSDSNCFSLGSSVPNILCTSLGISITLRCFTTSSECLASSWLIGSSLSLGTQSAQAGTGSLAFAFCPLIRSYWRALSLFSSLDLLSLIAWRSDFR